MICGRRRGHRGRQEAPLKLICIEEHTTDFAIAKAVAPAMQVEAPYFFSASDKADVPSSPSNSRPSAFPFRQALELGVDIGQVRLQQMDAHGIDMQIVSNAYPVQLAPPDQAVALTQAENDRIAKAVSENMKRLAGFAVLPWHDVEAAVRELDRAVGDLGLKAVMIAGRPALGNIFLDHVQYEPVLKRLHELKVPLYIHPSHPAPDVQKAYYDGLSPEITPRFSIGGWGWHHEAGIQVVRMILAGVFEKYPDLQIISGHWGEMVPFFLARLDDVLPPGVTGLSRSISETYRSNIWVTPSGLFDLPHFEFIHKVVGPDRIMWSNDYPFLTLDGTRPFFDNLPISDADRAKIGHLNAERLFAL